VSLEYWPSNHDEQINEQLAILNSRIVGIVKLKQRKIIWCNDAYAHLFGFTPQELLGQSVRALYQNEAEYQNFWQDTDQALSRGAVVRTQLQLKHKNGTLEWYEASGERLEQNNDESIWALVNISEHKRREKKIQQLAFCDALTNLPNRRMLYDRLDHALTADAQAIKYGALMMLDLDNFKHVNDTYGHDAGDCLLIEVGQRLKASVREADVVARIGGDEFIVLVTHLSDDLMQAKLRAELIAEKLRSILAEPYQSCAQYELASTSQSELPWCTASIGVVMFPQNQGECDDYIKCADAAMYTAKRSGGNQFYFYVNE
jgi:diguanylate cyclase (GGDEF)-like protein/PAS domain S-box-containing protein